MLKINVPYCLISTSRKSFILDVKDNMSFRPTLKEWCTEFTCLHGFPFVKYGCEPILRVMDKHTTCPAKAQIGECSTLREVPLRIDSPSNFSTKEICKGSEGWKFGQLGCCPFGDLAPLGTRTPSGVTFGFAPWLFARKSRGLWEKEIFRA